LVPPNAQVKAWADSRSLQVVGVYHANERLDDKEFGPGPRKIADKLQQQCSPTACGLLVCSNQLLLSSALLCLVRWISCIQLASSALQVDNQRLGSFLRGDDKSFVEVRATC
jgi:Uncharacterised protein family (UPF0172)